MTESHPNRVKAEEMRIGGNRVVIGLGSKISMVSMFRRTDEVGNVRV